MQDDIEITYRSLCIRMEFKKTGYRMSKRFFSLSAILLTTSTLLSCAQGQMLDPSPESARTPSPGLAPAGVVTPAIQASATSALPQPTDNLAAQPGIGVSRKQVQSAYEELKLVFEPPTVEQSQPFVIGGVNLNDGSSIVIILAGPERNLAYTSVTIVEPTPISPVRDLDSGYYRNWRSAMQILLDAVFPYWKDSKAWLNVNLGPFRMLRTQNPPIKARRGNNEIILEVLLNDPMPNFSSAVLTIQTAGKAP